MLKPPNPFPTVNRGAGSIVRLYRTCRSIGAEMFPPFNSSLLEIPTITVIIRRRYHPKGYFGFDKLIPRYAEIRPRAASVFISVILEPYNH